MLDLDRKRNMIQVFVLQVFAIVGAIVGYGSVDEARWIGALIGAVVCGLGSVLVSGAVFSIVYWTAYREQQAQVQLKQMPAEQYYRRDAIARCAGTVMLISGFWLVVSVLFGLLSMNAVMTGMLLVFFPSYLTAMIAAGSIQEVTCPKCHGEFGRHNLFGIADHECTSCGQTMPRYSQ